MKIKEYIVKPGDTLSSISKKLYGDAYLYLDIVTHNGIKNSNLIFPGQVLKLPIPVDDPMMIIVPVTPTRERLDAIADLFKPGFCDGRIEYAIYAAAIGVEDQYKN